MLESCLSQRDFRIRAAEGGSLLAFPLDAAAITALKATFPKARWLSAQTAWFLPGPRVAARAAAFIETFPAGDPDEANCVRLALIADPLPAPAAFLLQPGPDAINLTLPYSPELVDLLHEIPGAFFERHPEPTWSVPFRSASIAALRARLAELERLVRLATPY